MIKEKNQVRIVNLLSAEKAKELQMTASVQIEQNELQRILALVESAAVFGEGNIRTELDSNVADVVLKALEELKYSVVQEDQMVTVSW